MTELKMFAWFTLLTTSVLSLQHGCASAADDSHFTSQTVRRSGEILLEGPPDEIFPLFGPVREAEWAEGWSIEALFPANGQVVEGMVFRTEFHGGRKLIWSVSLLDPSRRIIRYTTFLADDYTGQIEIRCEAAGSKTRAIVTYTWTSLGPEGEKRVAEATEQQHQHRLAQWQAAINHLRQTGKRMSHHE